MGNSGLVKMVGVETLSTELCQLVLQKRDLVDNPLQSKIDLLKERRGRRVDRCLYRGGRWWIDRGVLAQQVKDIVHLSQVGFSGCGHCTQSMNRATRAECEE